MNRKILVLSTALLVAVIVTASVFAAFTVLAQTPTQTQPAVNAAYIMQALNTTMVVTNNQTGVTTAVIARLTPNVVGPNGVQDNKFTLMSTVVEFKAPPNATSNQTVYVLGAMSLLENEVNPVIAQMVAYNWSILNVNPHMKQETPKLQMVHWQTQGNLTTIVANIRAILNMTSLNVTAPIVPQTALNVTQIANLIGGVPVNGAVADVIVSRNDTNITSTQYPDIVLNGFALMSCVFEFAPYPMNATNATMPTPSPSPSPTGSPSNTSTPSPSPTPTNTTVPSNTTMPSPTNTTAPSPTNTTAPSPTNTTAPSPSPPSNITSPMNMSQKVVVMGTFALLESEVDAVQRILFNGTVGMQNATSTNATSQNVTMVSFTAMNNHMLQETPKIMQIHFQMIGELNQTINLINRALNATSIRGNMTSGNMTVTPQMQVANDVLNFIKTNHTQTTQYIPATINWTGGRINASVVGSETYVFVSGSWNVTMQAPVVPNPLYNINATYNSTVARIIWRGTWQNGSVTEGNFTFNATGPGPSPTTMPTTSPSPSPSGSPSASPSPSGSPSANVTNIRLYAGDYNFGTTANNLTSPGPTLQIKVGTTVNVTLTNVGQMPHAWALTTGLNTSSTVLYAVGSADNPLMPNQTASTTFTMMQAGNFYYTCPVSGHVALGMWGNVTATP